MRNLIDVVADPPQLGEQCRLHTMECGLGDLDLAIEHDGQAIARQLHTRTTGFVGQARVLVIRYTDVDLPVTLLRRVRCRAGHFTPHRELGSGRMLRPDRKGCRGRAERLSLAEVKRDLLANPHLATPLFYGMCFVQFSFIRFFCYSQLNVQQCSKKQYVHLLEYVARQGIMFSNGEIDFVQKYLQDESRSFTPTLHERAAVLAPCKADLRPPTR